MEQGSKSLVLPLLVLAVVAVGGLLYVQAGDRSSGTVSHGGAPGSRQLPPPQIIAIASASDIDVSAGKIERFDWTVPAGQPNCHLTGRVEVTSGGNKDVQVFVTTADEYKNLVNGHSAKSYLATDKTTVVNLDVRVGTPGPMVLAIGNTFSALTSKRVQLRDVMATCT